MFQGSIVALVTPFAENGEVDERKLRELVDWHILKGTQAILPCGTTGESATLSHEEHRRVIEVVVEQARRRVPVIAGSGSNSTKETIELTRYAEEIGADAALLITPYYNKPTPAGLEAHFEAVSKVVKIPLILYNVPGRTAVNLVPEVVIRLAKNCPNIVGIKEASGNLDQTSQIIGELGERFTVLSGDDSLTLPILALGGRGVISVLANILPAEMQQLCQLWKKGQIKEVQQLHLRLYPLMKAMFLETNPIPVKAAMEIWELCSGSLRLPLVNLTVTARQKLEKLLKVYKEEQTVGINRPLDS